MMATASQKLDELETVVTEAEQKDALQDAEFSLSKAEVTRLTDELRILKEQQANGELSPENVQRIDALIERIRAIDAIPDAVIPEGPPAEPPAE